MADGTPIPRSVERNAPVIQEGVKHVPMPESPTPEQLRDEADRKSKLLHRAITLLDRGITHDRLSVPLPKDVYGEWFKNDKFEIDRARSFGFEIDEKYAKERGLHSNGANGAVVGDVVFMTTSKENYEAIEKARHIRLMRDHGSKKQKEDSDYLAGAALAAGSEIPITSSGDARTVGKEEIRDAISEMDRQTQPQTPR